MEQKRECKKLLAQFYEMILWNANGANIGNFLIMRLCNDNQLNIITYQNVLCFIKDSNNFFIRIISDGWGIIFPATTACTVYVVMYHYMRHVYIF